MATITIQDRYDVWQKFLNRWPLNVLKSMTLPEYHTAGDPQQDNFVNWLEIHTECLGSIWGRSAFKFGIFNRAEHSDKISAGGFSYTNEYGWRSKYGTNPEEAYAAVHSLLLQIVEAAKRGDMTAIASIDFDSIVKWKIAFLYQPKDTPILPCVYAIPWLMKVSGSTEQRPAIDMYRDLMQRRNNQDILTFSIDLLEALPKTSEDSIAIESTEPNKDSIPLNRIFYGPPGTGKTWYSIDAALEVIDPEIFKLEDRKERKERFDALVKEKRVRFVTFHQSFSYEDFVEGIRPVVSDENEHGGQISYSVTPGIFKEMCEAAEARTIHAESDIIDLAGRQIWKMSLGNSRGNTAYIYEECLRTGRLLMGWGDTLDFSDCTSATEIRALIKEAGLPEIYATDYPVSAVERFVLHMKKGDIVVISEGLVKLRAIAEITGDYEAVNRDAEGDGYGQARKVRWLRQFEPSAPVDILLNKQFSQMTLYRLTLDTLERKNLEAILTPPSGEQSPGNYVLIIDEINRGNIAGIFGELITLIEPSKRIGEEEELLVRLPYSRELFGVPNNLYIIGTMNSADRSLSGLDIALRRRFAFTEMCPVPSMLENKILKGSTCSLKDILSAMNGRIEFLLDRDHCIGHAPFLSLGDVVTVEELAMIFKGSILPLLQEYFFDDWEKMHRIFNDHKKPAPYRFIDEKNPPQDIEDWESGVQRILWSVREDAFGQMESYIGIVSSEILSVFLTQKDTEPVLLDSAPAFSLPLGGTFMRACQFGQYTLVQYRENGSKAIRIYDSEEPVSGTLKSVLRLINEQRNLGISQSEEGNTRHFADELLNRLNVPLQS